MADFREKAPDAGAEKTENPLKASVERILMSYGDQTFQEFSRYRFAEEREWYEDALFYQRRQWLRWNDSSRRFDQVKQDPDKPKPMPVSNYFALAINSNANQLQMPRMVATPGDDSDANRRAAEYAQRGLKASDRETGMDLMRPVLAKHAVLWGIGITWDVVDTSASAGQEKIAEFMLKKTGMVSCLDCGVSSPTAEAPPSPAGNQGQDSDPSRPNMALGESGAMEPPDENQAAPCPACGSTNTKPFEANELEVGKVHEFRKGKLLTEVPPIFEVYLPRECRNPNLAKRIVRRYRKPLGQLRQLYGDRAANIKTEAPYDVHQIYMEALRALVNYNYMHEQTIESTTLTELWADWDEIPRRVQQRLEQFWADDPESLEAAIRCGIFEIYAGGTMLDWGPNPWWDASEQVAYKPATFFLWELDPANVYNKGLGVDLTPLQKRLNRLDSLVELGMMSNAAGKWLWPTTQSGKPPSGTPNEVIGYETIGEGKVKPEFVQPSPFHEVVPAIRASILADFQQLGNTLGAAQGQPPPNIKSFRGQALVAQKAEEQINTQRFLWESAHALRYRKILLMGQKTWDSPRKVKVAGYNGKFGMMVLDGQMMAGDYTLDFVADSSRPQLPAEKKQAFAELLQGGMVDPTDSSTREFVASMQNMDEVNLTDHLQYLKAERDLEKMKQGQVPTETPYQKWDIFLKVFANFTLTEEFELLNPVLQQGILLWCQHLSEMMTIATGGVPGQQPQQIAAMLAQSLQGAQGGQAPGVEPGSQSAGAELNKMPGQDLSSGNAQKAAVAEGQGVRAQLP